MLSSRRTNRPSGGLDTGERGAEIPLQMRVLDGDAGALHTYVLVWRCFRLRTEAESAGMCEKLLVGSKTGAVTVGSGSNPRDATCRRVIQHGPNPTRALPGAIRFHGACCWLVERLMTVPWG